MEDVEENKEMKRKKSTSSMTHSKRKKVGGSELELKIGKLFYGCSVPGLCELAEIDHGIKII